jgi:GMP synthase-like glutamine amidotransferase
MGVPNCLVIQHVAPEGPFAIAGALSTAGVDVDICRVFQGDWPPADAKGLDGLVVMGGPMSAASDEGFPTRSGELALIADSLRHGIPVLGVCLGAQLLAVAAGAAVYPGGGGPEIGWGPVNLLPICQDDIVFSELPEELTVMHWHGDTFDLPPGAERLISNAQYVNQAFRLAPTAWGVQFHVEVDEDAVKGFVREFAHDLADLPGGAERIIQMTPTAVAELAASRNAVCGRFAELVANRVRNEALV